MYQDQLDNEKKKGHLPKAAILGALVVILALSACGGLASMSPMSSLDLLTYSIYNQGALTQAEMGDVAVLVMLNGEPVVVTNEGGQIMLNGEVNITESGIQACNGVIYVIDESLIPPSGAGEPAADVTEEATPEVTEEPTEPGTCEEGETIADILQADPRFTEFVAALGAAGLLDALDQPGAFTIFAAPDEVFEDLTPTPEGTAGAPTTITICHATSSEKNPYNLITVDVHALAGHSKHAGDIIPAPAEGCPDGDVTPTPLPTETPTPVPTDTAEPTIEVTPTEVPTEVGTLTSEPPIP